MYRYICTCAYMCTLVYVHVHATKLDTCITDNTTQA